MRIGLLGPLELHDAEDRPVPVTGVRQRMLLCRLALDPGRLVTVDRLVDDLWDAAPPLAPAAALQSSVSRLRRALDQAGPPGRGALGSHPAGYRLDLSPDRVDLHLFERLTAEGGAALRAGDPGTAARLLRAGLALWRGPVLADAVGARFATAPTARAEALRLTALEARVDAELAADGQAPSALVAELTAACASMPLREGLAARLVRALCADGRRADALASYDAIRRRLADQLGVDPGQELQDSYLAALRLETTPPRPPAAPVPAETSRGNLPAALTSFVGREAELALVAELLAAGRLTTITGPGGAGKTRLAITAASRVVTGAPDGVWLVELGGLPGTDATVASVAGAVLATLARPTVLVSPDLAAEGGGDPVTRLIGAVSTKRMLLVLDNAEHLVEPVAELVALVLAAAPGVRTLVTSQEPLGVVGEALCPLAPLPLPLVGAAPATSPAVALFAARAAAVRPGFRVDAQTVGDVVRVCRALDGLPLAIELAAARLRTLTLAEVAARLDDRFALLGRGSRGGDARHRTLRAVVDWSWELLGPDERVLLRQLSVFAGGAPAAAVTAVCGASPDELADLVDRSLVMPVDGRDGRRYRLLETVRAYAAERLDEAGERRSVEAAHTRYLLEVAEGTEPLLRTGAQLTAIAVFGEWQADLDAATARASPEVAVRLVAARIWFWWLTGQRRTAATQAAEALAVAGHRDSDGGPLDPAIGLCLLGVAALAQRPLGGPPGVSLEVLAALTTIDHPAALFAAIWRSGIGQLSEAGPEQPPGWIARTERMLAAAGQFADHPDAWCRAGSRLLAGHAAWDAGRPAEAVAAFDASRATFRVVGDRWGLLLAESSLAMATGADAPAAALAALREAERLAEELDGLAEVPELLVQIAGLAGRLGDYPGAEEALLRADGLAARSGDALLRARVRHARGEVARDAGDLDAAAEHEYAAVDLLAVAPAPPAQARFTAQLHSCLARVEAERGRLDVAGRLHQRALRLAEVTGDAPLRADVLERFAAWCALVGDAARRGARALGAAAALRQAIDGESEVHQGPGALPDAAAARDGCRSVLGETEFAHCWRQGVALTTPERVLAEEAPPVPR